MGELPRAWAPTTRGAVLWLSGLAVVLSAYESLSGLRHGNTFLLLTGVAGLVAWGGLYAAMRRHRVLADECGLVVTRGLRPAARIAWAEVAEVRREEDGRLSQLVVVCRDGQSVPTGLHPVDHRSLPAFVRTQTAA